MQPTNQVEPTARKTRARAETVEQPKSKKDQLIQLLRTKGGANVKQISEALVWQPHTVRAALTGLRKANIAVEKLPARGGEPSRYQISAKRSRGAQ